MTYYYDNKFVLTEHGSYFFPFRREFCFPPVMDILQEIFDLDDPEVYKEVGARLAVGRIIGGDYFTPTLLPPSRATELKKSVSSY